MDTAFPRESGKNTGSSNAGTYEPRVWFGSEIPQDATRPYPHGVGFAGLQTCVDPISNNMSCQWSGPENWPVLVLDTPGSLPSDVVAKLPWAMLCIDVLEFCEDDNGRPVPPSLHGRVLYVYQRVEFCALSAFDS